MAALTFIWARSSGVEGGSRLGDCFVGELGGSFAGADCLFVAFERAVATRACIG